jgi:hypothetical protein
MKDQPPENKRIEYNDTRVVEDSKKRESDKALRKFEKKSGKLEPGTYTKEYLRLFFDLWWDVLEPALATKFKVEVKDDNVTLKKLE